MTLSELKVEIQKYQYIEDTSIIDVVLASIIANRLKIGSPIWLIIIGASSGGKSQILRPMSMTDIKFMHRVDDLTENTFLSGMKKAKGDAEPSLLMRIGERGMLVISDLTVIFSKNSDSRAAIMSQFRMIYDGEMTKFVGTSAEPLSWKGYLGVLAGSTPSIYKSFEEVSDMGERFIYYRMKDYDPKKATKLALNRTLYGKELDSIIGNLYEEYIKEIVSNANTDVVIPENIVDRIIAISTLAEKIRTVVHVDWTGEKINRIPTPAMPMRAALQMMSIAKALTIMRGRELNTDDMSIIDWCAYSLANEEKRACLKILASYRYGVSVSTQIIADMISLPTSVVGNILQNLSAVGVCERKADSHGLLWRIKEMEDYQLIREINYIKEDTDLEHRNLTIEESDEMEKVADQIFESM